MSMRYRLGAKIGSGGAAEVFRARLDDGRSVAVKRIHPARLAEPRQAERLLEEAEVTTALEHPHIVRVHGIERDARGRLCLVMELVEGVDLARLLRAARVPLGAAVYIVGALLRALDHAHEHGRVVHRDVSPHNVLLAWDGAVKLSDFGLARAIGRGPTTGGLVRGKVGYLSPEQAQRAALDGRSDLFSVGIILYELLTGRPPHSGTEGEIVAQLLGKEPFRAPRALCPELPAALSELTLKLLERDRGRRYQSAREALAALPDASLGRAELAALLRNLREAGALDDDASAALSSTRPRRDRRALVLLAGLLLAGGATLGVGLWRTHDPPPEAAVPAVSCADATLPASDISPPGVVFAHEPDAVSEREADQEPPAAAEAEALPPPAPASRNVAPRAKIKPAPSGPRNVAPRAKIKPAPSGPRNVAPRAKIKPAPSGPRNVAPQAEIEPAPSGPRNVAPAAQIPRGPGSERTPAAEATRDSASRRRQIDISQSPPPWGESPPPWQELDDDTDSAAPLWQTLDDEE